MLKILKLCMLFTVIGCTVNPTETFNSVDSYSKMSKSSEAYRALQHKGVVLFPYAKNKHGYVVYMWADFRIDANGYQTFVAQLASNPNDYRVFKRKAVNVYYHHDPRYNNEFFIDFGKPYTDALYEPITRYIHVKKTGWDSYSGRMMDQILWDLPSAFDIFSGERLADGTVDNTYDDVKTSNRQCPEPFLPSGQSKLYDELRRMHQVMHFAYKLENSDSYQYLWLDLRSIGDTMNMAYTKPGMYGTVFKTKRTIVEVYTNKNNEREIIIDLGKQLKISDDYYLPRYIYVRADEYKHTGRFTDILAWGGDTYFDIQSRKWDFWETQVDTTDYSDTYTGGYFTHFTEGYNPKTYYEAYNEAMKRIGIPTILYTRYVATYNEKGSGSVVKKHTKEIYLRQYSATRTYGLKSTWITELNGESGAHSFKNYFGYRHAYGARYLESPHEPSSVENIMYKGNFYSEKWLESKGFYLYDTVARNVDSITNILVGGNNVWEDLVLTPHRNFLIKQEPNNEFIIVDGFQTVTEYMYVGGIRKLVTKITEPDFDIDNPSSKFRYKMVVQ